jgi:hypothetical protein
MASDWRSAVGSQRASAAESAVPSLLTTSRTRSSVCWNPGWCPSPCMMARYCRASSGWCVDRAIPTADT